MQCSVCGERKEDRVETFHMLALNQIFSTQTFKTDLEASLDEYFKSENLIVNCEKCASPNSKKSMMTSTFDSSPEMKLSDTLHVKNVSFAALPRHLSIMINAQWDPFTGAIRSNQRWSYPGMKSAIFCEVSRHFRDLNVNWKFFYFCDVSKYFYQCARYYQQISTNLFSEFENCNIFTDFHCFREFTTVIPILGFSFFPFFVTERILLIWKRK